MVEKQLLKYRNKSYEAGMSFLFPAQELRYQWCIESSKDTSDDAYTLKGTRHFKKIKFLTKCFIIDSNPLPQLSSRPPWLKESCDRLLIQTPKKWKLYPMWECASFRGKHALPMRMQFCILDAERQPLLIELGTSHPSQHLRIETSATFCAGEIFALLPAPYNKIYRKRLLDDITLRVVK